MCVHLMFADAHDTTNDAINSDMNRRRIFHIVTSACAAHAEPDFAEREYDAHGKLGRDADAAVDNATRRDAACVCCSDGMDTGVGIFGNVGRADALRSDELCAKAYHPRGSPKR